VMFSLTVYFSISIFYFCPHHKRKSLQPHANIEKLCSAELHCTMPLYMNTSTKSSSEQSSSKVTGTRISSTFWMPEVVWVAAGVTQWKTRWLRKKVWRTLAQSLGSGERA
jgi:hypothetical protein